MATTNSIPISVPLTPSTATHTIPITYISNVVTTTNCVQSWFEQPIRLIVLVYIITHAYHIVTLPTDTFTLSYIYYKRIREQSDVTCHALQRTFEE